MYRICRIITTGKIIEMQSAEAPFGTLLQNAYRSGYKADEIEELAMDEAQYKGLFDAQVLQPQKDKAAVEKQKAKDIVVAKLHLSDEEIGALKVLLNS